MDGVGIADFGRADDAGDVQVTASAFSWADANRFVRETGVQAVAVGLGVDGHGANAQILAGANDAQRNFAPVRNQDFLKHA